MAEPKTSAAKPGAGSATGRKPGAPAVAATKYSFTSLLPADLSIDFVGKRTFFVVLSTILNLAAIALIATWGLNLGVDFKGGTDVRVRFVEPTTAASLRAELDELHLRDLTVQDFGVQGKEFLMRFEVEEGQEMSSITDVLSEVFKKTRAADGAFEILSVESVGPRVGSALRRQGFLAVAFATVFMGIYIALRFDLSFGAGAVIALIHDVLITMGALVVTRIPFDLTTLAGLLTVVGFSVHDTIIVSDRIREKLKRERKAELGDIINRSINETLSRTLLTTGTALLVLLTLYFLGGTGLRPFAFTLIIGFVTGTYSSIYIAAPVVLFWSKRSKLGTS